MSDRAKTCSDGSERSSLKTSRFWLTFPWVLWALTLVAFGAIMMFWQPEKADPKPYLVAENAPYRRAKVVVKTPAKTTYRGEQRDVKRTVEVARIFSPFGVSAGEAISKQEPMKIVEGPTPAINVTPKGMGSEKGGGTDIKTGGYEWTLFDTIWIWIKKIFWFGVIGVGILVAIMFLVPGAGPIVGGILRGIASIFPFIGSMVEWLVGKFKFKKPLVQTVNGGQKFKQAIDAEPSLSPDQKSLVKKKFNETMAQNQDDKSQGEVKKIKTGRAS